MPSFALCVAIVAELVATNSEEITRSAGLRSVRLDHGIKVSRAIAEDSGLFRYDYDYNKEICGWVKLEQVPATWKDAYLNCYYEGAVLLSPETVLKWNVMQSLINDVYSRGDPRSVHTGIHTTFGKGAYHSVEGTPLNRMPVLWAPSQPTVCGESLTMLPDGRLASIRSSEAHPYICYKERNKNQELTECGTFDKGYTLENKTGSCYKVHTSPLDWNEAFSACSHEGGHLVIVNSAVEAQVLSKRLKEAQPMMVAGKYRRNAAFIGITNFRDHMLWMTIHGQTLREAGYEGWAKEEPNDSTGIPGCGTIYLAGDLDDTPCDSKLPFICEMTPYSLTRQSVQAVCQA